MDMEVVNHVSGHHDGNGAKSYRRILSKSGRDTRLPVRAVTVSRCKIRIPEMHSYLFSK